MKNLFWVIFSLLTLASCSGDNPNPLQQQDMGEIIAEVGDKKFYETDIDFEIMSLPESMRYMMRDELVRGQVLDVMIKREVVSQKAKEMGLNLDPLMTYRMRKAENEILIQGVRDWNHSDLKHPTAKEIKVYYESHLDEFIIPKQIHARHILVADKQTAVEIIKQVKANPESFPTLAAQFSIDDSTKGRGGDLNWFARDDMLEAFDKAAFALNNKKPLSQPVKTKFGWHIIEWLGEREQQTPSFEEVEVEIKSILEKEKLDTWIKGLMNNASIKVLKAAYIMERH
ncbi:MAG: peptidylprolyl isomerase [Ghiorsea sp.]